MQLINQLFSYLTWPFIVTIFGVGMAVIVAELLERTNITHGEYSRKLTHIIGGIIIGLSAFYLSKEQLLLLCFILTVGVIMFGLPIGIVKSLEAVRRQSIGQYVYAIGIALVLIIFDSRALFMAATLTMGLADGLAALVGWRYGVKKYRFKIPGGSKTYLGSSAFFIATFFILTLYLFVISANYFGAPTNSFSLANLAIVTLISAVVTLSEATTGYGMDNVIVPLLTASLLYLLL